MTSKPLEKIRVLDLTSHIAGPFCTKLLADYGAEVIKVEKPPVGDITRTMGPYPDDLPDSEASGLYIYLNANKKSVTINLENSSGQAILRELGLWADLAILGLPPRSLHRLGVEPAALEEINPKLASVSITNFGLTGPYRDYKADHLILCAAGGWAQYLGEKNRPPLQAGFDLVLQVAGLRAASTAMALLSYSRKTGMAHHADLSIHEVVTEMLPASPLRYAMTGTVETRGMYPFPSQGILKCNDGYIGVNTLTEDHWERLCQWSEMGDLIGDERFPNSAARWEHSEYIRDRAEVYFSQKGKEELFDEGQSLHVATGLVSNMADILNLKQLKNRDYFAVTNHPRMAGLLQPGPPIRMERSPWAIRRPAPALGADNYEVLSGQLGLSRDELVILREQGAI